MVGLTVVVVLLALVTGLLWAFQRRLVYLPADGPVPAAADVLPGARDVVLQTSDGLALGAWFVPGADAAAPAVLVANGNGGHRAARAPLARALAARGLAVLLFDYRGYGGNPGSPSEEGLARDVRAARAHLTEREAVAPDRLLYLGESLGAAVVTELATEYPPAGLVLRSPFVDLAAVGSEHYPFLPVRALLRDRYRVAERVATVEVPTTVVLGDADTIVPPRQSRAVAAAAAGLHRLVEVPGADHNDPVLLDGAALVDAVVDLAGG
ncbi:alpha/beta hydrolase [Geodermatophilus sabuli]|uniref:Alpha/beta hydrolase n=1 Tax=Geodermatophilus sabuli TaxID=1564158 RepID=A0A7K3W7T6_9ACTN|nr:alpha/beta hydrolase [Geodermatophilus sabuli]